MQYITAQKVFKGMLTIWYTKGLPGSGKSTWARQKLNGARGKVVRSSKDDLRAMLHDGVWSKHNEKFVLKARDFIVREALSSGSHVIVDDTNLVDTHVQTMQTIAKEFGAKVEVVDFTHVPVEECIARDAKREKPVGEKVIRDMNDKHLKPATTVRYQFDPTLPDCTIIDLDGTTALNNGHRNPFDFTKVYEDEVNEPVVATIKAYLTAYPNTAVIAMSGRDDSCYGLTWKWLQDKATITPDFLLMRATGDRRKDAVVKNELFDNFVRSRFSPRLVFDDRAAVCTMWRSLGLTVMQVAEGNF